MSRHVLVQDPSSISSRFSNSDRLGFDGGDTETDLNSLIERSLAPEAEEELSDGFSLDFNSIERYLPRIPPREADLISMYYRDRMKQEQIARLFGITQAAVSYRLHRGIRRIQFLRTIPELYKDLFDSELGPSFSGQDLEILWRMYETTCQSEIAKLMGLTQGRVRHRFFRSLARIKDLIAEEARELRVNLTLEARRLRPVTEEVSASIQRHVELCIERSRFAKYFTVFFAISDKHFNILHEVSLPQFKNRGDSTILPLE
jgi:DNA-directed RNA polymerase specialized sigma24 family protein